MENFSYVENKKYKKVKYNVILIHGYISSKEIFRDIYKGFRIKGVNFYAIDLKTIKVKKKQKFVFETLHEQIIEFIKQKQLDNLILVGHSMGGGVVANLWESIKDKVKKIVLISPLAKSLIRSKASSAFLSGTIRNDINLIKSTLFADKIIQTSVDDILERDYLNFLKNKSLFFNLGLQLILPSTLKHVNKLYKSITVPTLLFLGKKDKIIPGVPSEKDFKKMQNSNFEFAITDCGHVVWLENWESFKQIFINFITK